MNYYYTVFGFSIKSEIRLPFLDSAPVTNEVSLEITFRQFPEHITSKNVEFGINYENTPTEFLMLIPKVAKYYVANGQSIFIQAFENATEKDIVHFLMNPIFIVCLHQKGMLPMHGSVVEKNGKGIMICGAPGFGQSSLVASLLCEGFNLVAEDLCVFDKDGQDAFCVLPYQPKISLPEHVSDHLVATTHPSSFNLEKYGAMRNGLQKCNWVVRKNQFCAKPVTLWGIYMLSVSLNSPDYQITTIQNRQYQFAKLFERIYFYQLSFSNTHRKQLFQSTAQMANSVPMKKLHITHGAETHASNAHIIKQDFERANNTLP